MKFLLNCLVGILLSFFLFLNVTKAQTPGRLCASNESFSLELSMEFGEYLTSFMLQKNSGILILLYSNKKTGTWTLAKRLPQLPKITCIVTSGDGYVERKKDAINYSQFDTSNNGFRL